MQDVHLIFNTVSDSLLNYVVTVLATYIAWTCEITDILRSLLIVVFHILKNLKNKEHSPVATVRRLLKKLK